MIGALFIGLAIIAVLCLVIMTGILVSEYINGRR